MKKLLILLVVLSLLLSLAPVALADQSETEAAADALYEMGLFRGTGTDSEGKPVYELDRAPTRYEGVTMLVRLLGKEREALNGAWDTPFTDVVNWAKPYVGYAYENGLTTGVSATAFGGDATITATQYLTFVLRALGYESGADFRWDAAWELSDALGISGGRYTAENNGAFLRGDAAIVSEKALDVSLKDGSAKLYDRIMENLKMPEKEEYICRVLSDSQLAALRGADLATLQKEISTVGDAAAFLDLFDAYPYSGFEGEIRLDLEFVFHLHTRPEASTPQTYAAFAAWCLADDYDGIHYVLCLIEREGDYQVLIALALPVENGYYIYSPQRSSARVTDRLLPQVEVASLTELSGMELGEYDFDVIQQTFVADAEQTDLRFRTDAERMEPTLVSGSASQVYAISDAEKEAAEEERRQQRIKFAWEQLNASWSSYGMPTDMAPTMSRAEVEALVGRDIDTVAAACKTLGDCLYYYALSGFTGSGGDLQTYDGSIGGSLHWHYNYVPAAVFAFNTGNCGASSGLTAYLLQGDYAEMGMLDMTFAEGEGGGHVINYIYDGNDYYVFDIVNLLAAFHQGGFCFSSGSSFLSAAQSWIGKSGYPVKLMMAYQSFAGDAPVGWDWANSHISYLPEAYKDGGEILIETPSEGYVYQWVSIRPEIWEQIHATRDPMLTTPAAEGPAVIAAQT